MFNNVNNNFIDSITSISSIILIILLIFMLIIFIWSIFMFFYRKFEKYWVKILVQCSVIVFLVFHFYSLVNSNQNLNTFVFSRREQTVVKSNFNTTITKGNFNYTSNLKSKQNDFVDKYIKNINYFEITLVIVLLLIMSETIRSIWIRLSIFDKQNLIKHYKDVSKTSNFQYFDNQVKKQMITFFYGSKGSGKSKFVANLLNNCFKSEYIYISLSELLSNSTNENFYTNLHIKITEDKFLFETYIQNKFLKNTNKSNMNFDILSNKLIIIEDYEWLEENFDKYNEINPDRISNMNKFWNELKQIYDYFEQSPDRRPTIILVSSHMPKNDKNLEPFYLDAGFIHFEHTYPLNNIKNYFAKNDKFKDLNGIENIICEMVEFTNMDNLRIWNGIKDFNNWKMGNFVKSEMIFETHYLSYIAQNFEMSFEYDNNDTYKPTKNKYVWYYNYEKEAFKSKKYIINSVELNFREDDSTSFKINKVHDFKVILLLKWILICKNDDIHDQIKNFFYMSDKLLVNEKQYVLFILELINGLDIDSANYLSNLEFSLNSKFLSAGKRYYTQELKIKFKIKIFYYIISSLLHFLLYSNTESKIGRLDRCTNAEISAVIYNLFKMINIMLNAYNIKELEIMNFKDENDVILVNLSQTKYTYNFDDKLSNKWRELELFKTSSNNDSSTNRLLAYYGYRKLYNEDSSWLNTGYSFNDNIEKDIITVIDNTNFYDNKTHLWKEFKDEKKEKIIYAFLDTYFGFIEKEEFDNNMEKILEDEIKALKLSNKEIKEIRIKLLPDNHIEWNHKL